MPLPLVAASTGGFAALWAINTAIDAVSNATPRVTHTVQVRAQGAREAPLDSVVHLALATALGCIRYDPGLLANTAIKVEVSHTKNSAVVSYQYSTKSFFPPIREVYNSLKNNPLFDSNAPREARLIGGVQLISPVGGGLAVVGLEAIRDAARRARRRWLGGGGQIDKTPAGTTPPAIANNPAQRNKRNEEDPVAGAAREAAATKMNLLAKPYGLDVFYRLGRTTIRGGKPTPMLAFGDPDKDEGIKNLPKPFGDMVGRVLLTREPDANPVPPSAHGGDLRSLVAQVLHDPGVRPPSPLTAFGPPTTANEQIGL